MIDHSEHDRDQYGGWTARKFEASGYFRLEKGEDRWWLVTPEGNAFLIHGMDHVGLEVITRDYNRSHWVNEWGLGDHATREQIVAPFYEQKVARDREYLGFNCMYSHQAPVGMNVCPYIPRVQTIMNEYWRTWRNDFSEANFMDVFADEFEVNCNESAQAMVRQNRVEDAWIVALGLTDSPVLTTQMAMPHGSGFFHKPLPGTTTWPVRLRNLGQEAPGKQAYVQLMKDRYDAIQNLNACYNTAFEAWDALAAAENWRTRTDPTGNIHEERDNDAFLVQILDKAWGTQARIIRKHNPNHILFGDTLNLNEPVSDETIRVYARHFPVIAYQYYGATLEDHLAVMDRFRRVAPDTPIFSADSCWGVCEPPHMPDTLGPQCANQEIRAERFQEVYHAAFARPDFIGWGWCGWMDKWERAEPHMQHGGLQDAFGVWHQPIADAMSQFGKEMYSIAST